MSGMKINPGLVMMQHKSNMISRMMGGGRTSSPPGMLGDWYGHDAGADDYAAV